MQCLTRTQEFIGECIEQGLNLHDLEREFIVVALERAKDKRVAAKQVGVCMQTLYKKINKHQIKKFQSFPIVKKDTSLPSGLRLGELIRQARKRKGIEPKELAYFLGYKNCSSISHIEHGRRPVPRRLASRLSIVLGIPLPHLYQAILEAESEMEKSA